jgi:hypothetical protein
MKKLSKEKRQQLLLVALLTAGALIGLYLGLIKFQSATLKRLQTKKLAADQQLRDVKHSIANATQIESQLGESAARLAKLEETLASGDLYAWTISTMRKFKLSYKVEIPQFSQIDGPRDSSLLPQFPYKQATLTVGGYAFFYDFGKFLSDFENQFPYARVLNLNLEPMSTMPGGDREKLSFRMEIAMLVKPGTS